MPWLKFNSIPRILLFAVVVFLVVYPLTMMLTGSLRTEMLGLAGTWGIAGWIEAYTDPAMLRVIWNTVQIAVAKLRIAGDGKVGADS